MQRAGSSGARGECDISRARRLWLEEAARLGCTVHTSPGGGRRPGQAAGMSAKERPKGKVIKDSVTLLPCFYFVEGRDTCVSVGLVPCPVVPVCITAISAPEGP
ncbi:Hypothetical predicted protein [Marmota monax]|uniref:Uncharacterized protein n=1 Tax=Marmota monax TaxID=9995 RepID=A0A5E4CD93_MARMO|nr:Hypothetical predicted protein [Marmota monax]